MSEKAETAANVDNGGKGDAVSKKVDHRDDDDTINDSGLFFSPQPLTSKLVRCASTPLSDKALQSLLNLDFEHLASGDRKSRSGTDLSSTNDDLSGNASAYELTKARSEPLITRVINDGQLLESQELVLSFKGSDVSTHVPDINRRTQPGGDAENRPRLLSDDFDFGQQISDSGFGSDFSVSSANTSQLSSSASSTTSPALVTKFRDIFDSKKPKAASASRTLQRTVRFAHLPGS